MPAVCSDNNTGLFRAPSLEKYYHGLIDRAEAERRLKVCGVPNSYLLRLSGQQQDHGRDCLYVLSYLSSKLECSHFKLIPRLNCFQLGGRLFDCLQGCLSRYYVHDLMTGERLRHPVEPYSPPVEIYKQLLRATQTFEPDNINDRLGCTVGDRFLLVSETSECDWLLVTSLRTRHSGYLPKFCIEKEYPELVDGLDFFHPDTSSSEVNELFKKAGAYSYLLRPCDSLPGLYTLLLYDGIKVRKFRLELKDHLESIIIPPSGHGDDDPQRRASDPLNKSPRHSIAETNNGGGSVPDHLNSTDLTPRCHSDQVSMDPTWTQNQRCIQRVFYKGIPFVTVNAVVATIEAHFNLLDTPEGSFNANCPRTSPSKSLEIGQQYASSDGCEMDVVIVKTPPLRHKLTTPQVFKPIHREYKPQTSPLASTIYMSLRYNRPSLIQHSKLELHGELSKFAQRKKWKSYYAQLDRNQGILTLRDNEKRKQEHFDLCKCDYFPLHRFMYDRHFCFGLLLYGASAGDREDLVFSVDPPTLHSPCTMCNRLANSPTTNNRSSVLNTSFSRPDNLEPTAYAGRPEDLVPPVLSTCNLRSAYDIVSIPLVSEKPTCTHQTNASMETIHTRWVNSVRKFCRNTREDAANEVDFDRKQTHPRCYRTLEIRINSAKLMPPSCTKSRRDDSTYLVTLDGSEIARAYSGSATESIIFNDFPMGFKKVEFFAKEEHKRKRIMATHMYLGSSIVQQSGRTTDGGPVCQTVIEFPRRSNICNIRESDCPQGSIIYKELHVLPFSCYAPFREVIQTRLESEFVPMCIHVWENLPNEQESKIRFLSSLLFVSMELRCHLQLIFNLLRLEIIPANPTDSFRGNALGTQMLEVYSKMVSSEWRDQCFRRVREHAMQGPPISNLNDAGSPIPGRLVDTDSVPSTPQTPTRSSVPNARNSLLNVATRPHSLSVGSAVAQNVGPSDPPPLCTVGIGTSATTKQPQTPPVPHQYGVQPVICHINSCSSSSKSENEWLSHLISITVDDLVSHMNQFPLQIRRIYSQLHHGLQSDQLANSVFRNLILLRGICPYLSYPENSTGRGSLSGSISGNNIFPSHLIGSSGKLPSLTIPSADAPAVTQFSASPHHSPANRTSDALVRVAKSIMALMGSTSMGNSIVDKILSPEQCSHFRQQLLDGFRMPILSQLSLSEMRQLDQRIEREAVVASYRSLSRDLAQLAHYFWDHTNIPTMTGCSRSEAPFRTGSVNLSNSLPPHCPVLTEVLSDLDQRTLYLSKTSPCLLQTPIRT